MNKKLTFKAPNGNICYCVLSGEQDLKEQIERIFAMTGDGYITRFDNKEISIIDIYHWDPIAVYEVISVEDCDMEVCEKRIKIGTAE